MSSDIVALPATDIEALKQRLDALVASTSSPSVLMPSNIVALPAADVEVLKQRLNALVTATEAAEEKVALPATRRRVLAAHQLLDKEQGAAVDLERQGAAKKLVPGSTSSSTMETMTTFPSYIDTIIANFHIQADTMMEEIHFDTSGLAAAPTAFYSNKMPPAPLPLPLIRTTAATTATVTAAATTGIGTTTAATAVVTAITTTPLWLPTAPPPTTVVVPHYGRHR
jgi:hypothetical protein